MSESKRLCFIGGYGVDFSDSAGMNSEKLVYVAKKLLETGVTAFCPTLVSIDKSEYKKLIPILRPSDGRETGGASVLGIHLEGPFFSTKKIGAHPLKNIRIPAEADFEEIYGGRENLDNVIMITLAPELSGSLDLIRRYTELPFKLKGKRVASMGHSNATLYDAECGVESGATMITHLFNAMGG